MKLYCLLAHSFFIIWGPTLLTRAGNQAKFRERQKICDPLKILLKLYIHFQDISRQKIFAWNLSKHFKFFDLSIFILDLPHPLPGYPSLIKSQHFLPSYVMVPLNNSNACINFQIYVIFPAHQGVKILARQKIPGPFSGCKFSCLECFLGTFLFTRRFFLFSFFDTLFISYIG